MYGLTDAGFNRKRYADIIKEKEARAKELFGNDVNLSENSPLGMFIKLNAWEESQVWEMAEAVYYSAYLNSASGISLDRLVRSIGISRLPALFSTGTITITGAEGTFIPAGRMVKTSDKVQYKTVEEVTIPSGGSVDVGVIAVVAGGAGNKIAGALNALTNPIAGVAYLANTGPTTGGADKESDGLLRARYARSLAVGGAATVDSIQAALINTPGVVDALVRVNNTDVEVAGRPAKSFEVYVVGGTDEDVANTIFHTAAAGIQPYGTTTVEVTDASGYDHSIGFTRSPQVQIYVDIDLETDVLFPVDGVDRVKNNIIEYLGGTGTDGVEYRGISMGQPVIYNQLVQAALKVPGVTDVVVKAGLAANPTGQVNISIPDGSIATVLANNITVVV